MRNLQVLQQNTFLAFFENILHDLLFIDAHKAVGKFQVGNPEKLEKRKMELVSSAFFIDYFSYFSVDSS